MIGLLCKTIMSQLHRALLEHDANLHSSLVLCLSQTPACALILVLKVDLPRGCTTEVYMEVPSTSPAYTCLLKRNQACHFLDFPGLRSEKALIPKVDARLCIAGDAAHISGLSGFGSCGGSVLLLAPGLCCSGRCSAGTGLPIPAACACFNRS